MNESALLAAAGNALLALALLAALAGMLASLSVVWGRRGGLRWARVLSWAAMGLAVAASLCLFALLLLQRYDVAYVADYTSRDLDFFYRLSAFWAGQQGSFLLWLLLTAILTVLQLRRSRQFEPYVLIFLLSMQAALTIFLLRDSPFRLVPGATAPADGYGLNPLLQNPWMVSHPPLLFLGYAGLAVPFAYALGGLWRRDYDEWVRLALPWALLGWFFLGLGIYLGAFWAYETLGWGGYWGWDLVENSSLIPWITATALVHGMLIQRHRQRLRHANFLLAIATLVLILYATFITRSGVLSAVSNHSFGVSELTPWLLAVLGLTLVGSLLLFLMRRRDIPQGPLVASETRGGRPARGEASGTMGRGPASWFSRDLTFVLTIILLIIITAPIWIGSLVPVVTQIGGNVPATLDVSAYPLTTGPWVALMLLVLCLCPFLGWSGSDWRRVLRFLVGPAIFALLATVVAVILGVGGWIGILFVLLGAFAAASNAVMVVRTARGGVLRLGGYLTHVGLGLLLIGIVASTMYGVDGAVLALPSGGSQETLGYRLTFLGEGGESEEQRTLWFEVERGAERFTATPERRYSRRDGNWMATPYIQRNLAYDLYLAVEGYEQLPGTEVRVDEGQVVQAAGYTLTLQSLLVDDPYVTAVIAVERGGRSALITPTYALPESGAVGRPAYLPGGETLTVEDAFKLRPDLLVLAEGVPVVAGEYRLTMRDFYMEMHDELSGTIRAGAVVDVLGPEGTTVVTPTQVVGPAGLIAAPPVALSPGVTITLAQMAVEQRAIVLQVEGQSLPGQGGSAILLIHTAGVTGQAYVRMSLKPGMNLVWGGGLLLLLGTATAAVRRWREVGS